MKLRGLILGSHMVHILSHKRGRPVGAAFLVRCIYPIADLPVFVSGGVAVVEGGPEDNNPEVQGEDGQVGDAVEESQGVDVVANDQDHRSGQGNDSDSYGQHRTPKGMKASEAV